MTQIPTPEDKAAYLKAQKMRNYAIGAGLLLFVVLIYFVTQVRMAENMEAEQAAIAASSAASVSQ